MDGNVQVWLWGSDASSSNLARVLHYSCHPPVFHPDEVKSMKLADSERFFQTLSATASIRWGAIPMLASMRVLTVGIHLKPS